MCSVNVNARAKDQSASMASTAAEIILCAYKFDSVARKWKWSEQKEEPKIGDDLLPSDWDSTNGKSVKL